MEQIYQKFCQSCSMPLNNGEMSGTELDGTKSLKYCHLCYQNGKFTTPDTTLEEMKKILDQTIGRQGIPGKFKAFMGKMILPKLERWQTSTQN
jgi:hypothetical protein